MEDDLVKIVKNHKEKMDKIFQSISINKKDKFSLRIFGIAKDYYDDSSYFIQKEDFIRAFEALMISWSFIDAGLINGSFSLPEELLDYFIL